MSLITVILQRDGVRDRRRTRCSGASKAEVHRNKQRWDTAWNKADRHLRLSSEPHKGFPRTTVGKSPSHVPREAFFPPQLKTPKASLKSYFYWASKTLFSTLVHACFLKPRTSSLGSLEPRPVLRSSKDIQPHGGATVLSRTLLFFKEPDIF